MPNILGWSSYNLIGANTGYQRHNNYDIWGLNLRCEFSTRSFYKHSRYSPFVSGYAVRSFPSLKFQRCYASLASREQKSRKILLYLTALVLAMVGSSYAAVPLYRRFCQATGYGGTIQRREVWLGLFLSFHFIFCSLTSFIIVSPFILPLFFSLLQQDLAICRVLKRR